MIDFTQSQIAEIVSLRKAGETHRQLADKFYCSAPTIGRVLRANGISGRQGAWRAYPAAMIQHDYNAGVASSTIIRKYRMKNRHALKNLIHHYRQQGWFFRARRKGAVEHVRSAM